MTKKKNLIIASVDKDGQPQGLGCCRRGCDMDRQLWETVWQPLMKLNTHECALTLEKSTLNVHTKSCTQLLTAIPFITAKEWKQSECPSTGQRWYNWTMQTRAHGSSV